MDPAELDLMDEDGSEEEASGCAHTEHEIKAYKCSNMQICTMKDDIYVFSPRY